MPILREILRDTKGAEIAETAVVLPVLFMVLLGIFYFGRAYNIYGTINQAAMQGARASVAPSCSTCGNTPVPADQILANYVLPTLQASKLDPAQVQRLAAPPLACACVSGACGVGCDPLASSICVQRNIILNTTAGAHQECGTRVSFQYPYNFNLPFNAFSLQMKAAAQMRTEDQSSE